MANDPLTPPVRAGIVNRANRRILLLGKVLRSGKRQILTERKAGFDPGLRVPQRNPAPAKNQTQLPHQSGRIRVAEIPKIDVSGILICTISPLLI